MSGPTEVNPSTGEVTDKGGTTTVTSDGNVVQHQNGERTFAGEEEQSAAQKLAKELEGKPITPESVKAAEEKIKADALTPEEKAASEAKAKTDAEKKPEEKTEEKKPEVDPNRDPKWPAKGTAPADNDPRFEKFNQDFLANGMKLSAEATKAAAEEFGVSEALVSVYVAGLAAQTSETSAVQQHMDIANEFGGMTNYAAFNGWAADNISESDAKAYNKALADNPAAALAMAKGFKAAYAAAGQMPGRDITHGSVQAPSAQASAPFASLAEQKAAMNDPKYAKDPAYRKSVEQRIAVSKY